MSSFAIIAGAQGGVELPLEAAIDRLDGAVLGWLHLHGISEETRALLGERLGLPDLVVGALTAVETRPRCDGIGDGALINLRARAPDRATDADALVSIRVWTQRGRIVSVARYDIDGLDRMRAAMLAGRVRDPGDFVAMLADAITDDLDPRVAALGDMLDDCELMLDARRAFALRRDIARVRAEAIEYRRFVAPQRQALERLAALDCAWLENDDRLHLRESADRFARMTEELESIRERAALTSEQITDLRAELLDTRSLWISIVALIFLPLTFLTGLLGMNVEGIPYAREPWAFWGVVGVCAALAAGTFAWFMRSRWLR
ncbi:zinc transporter ZntB [Sphingomonas changnyeongensis]|uniref:Zinc transporter ZntB n=1 Tax=Sphingomonas changnyeongensis TaxID=2698679 RepID=A0A7Z2NV18_9SPHN|nr:zinc transporter ZntB [Sphingomonas changnyeongensis]QHL90333.1 zinc transporter ZntB [Sphingomonas changnyeongensis]